MNGLLVFSFLILIGLFILGHQKQNQGRIFAQTFLASIDSEERLLLEYFFRRLIQEDSIGFVLLNAKPMSFYSYIQPNAKINACQFEPLDKFIYFFTGFDSHNILMRKGWQVWKKYASRFCGNNIFFDCIEQDLELGFVKIAVMNKKLLDPIFASHFEKFAALDPSIRDCNSLFKAILYDCTFKTKIHSRPDLLGICLGYGEKNAVLFNRMAVLYEKLGYLRSMLYQPSLHRISLLQEELTALEKSLKICSLGLRSKRHLFNIGVGFRGRLADLETMRLQEKYTESHRLLTMSYRNVDFLEKTLELIYSANVQLNKPRFPQTPLNSGNGEGDKSICCHLAKRADGFFHRRS